MKQKMKSAATVVVIDAAYMTMQARKKIANWLRSRARLLEKHGDLLAPRYTARYLYSRVK